MRTYTITLHDNTTKQVKGYGLIAALKAFGYTLNMIKNWE